MVTRSRLLGPAIVCVLLTPVPTLGQTVSTQEDIEYSKVGDISLKLDVHSPGKGPSSPAPAIVFIHGGGWRAGNKRMLPGLEDVVKSGYVVVSISYRLSGTAIFPAAVEDCKSAVRWVRKNAKDYRIDPERIGVWGLSAGGHLALMVGCADEQAGLEGKGNEGVSSRVRAVCSWYGPADFMKGHTQFESGKGAAPLAFLGGTLEERPSVYKQASPITHASKDDPPVLMIHGDQDKVVPINQSEVMHAKLREAGVESTLIPLKGIGHAFRDKESIRATIEFFDKHLKR